VQNLKTFGRYAADQTRQAHQAVPVLQFLCDKLGEGLATRHPFAVQFCLESLLALLSHLPDQVALSSRYRSSVWRTLCPTLLEFVGLPGPDSTCADRLPEFRCVAR